MAKKFVNLTPHAIRLNDGRVFDPSGVVARVSASFSDFDNDGVAQQVFGDIQDIPAQQDGVFLIVSALVLSASKDKGLNRSDLVAPATGHPAAVRNDKGQIASVPGFVR